MIDYANLIEEIQTDLYLNATPAAKYSAEIDYTKHFIFIEDYERIVESHLKGKLLTSLTKNAIRNAVALSNSPTFL